MTTLRVTIYRLCLAAAAAGILGCNAPMEQLATFNRQFESGQLCRAAVFAADKISVEEAPRGNDLLWTLQLAATERMQQRYTASTERFDRAEKMLQDYATRNDEIAKSVAAAIVNDNVIPYTGTIYDGIMVNTYKALNFMYQGNYDLARVEFNRAMDRQRRAREDFAAQIQAVRDELNKNQHSSLAQRSADSPQLRAKLEQTYSNLTEFEAYPDFVNPFSTYLAGVFFLATNDYPKASGLLKEAAGMLPNNSWVLEDFATVEAALNMGRQVEPSVWFFFENGLGPVKEEVRLDLPLFVATDQVRYFGIALPQLGFRPPAAAAMQVQAEGKTFTTEMVGNMDRVIQTEFKKAFDGILLRTILSATAKAAAQYVLEKNNASNAALVMAIFNFATTAADVRIWSALPKNFQTARLDRPADGWVTLNVGSRPPIAVQLPDCTHAIIYVKMLSASGTPTVELIPF